jgi:hypothetical protein
MVTEPLEATICLNGSHGFLLLQRQLKELDGIIFHMLYNGLIYTMVYYLRIDS